MRIGVPKEIKREEYRVAITPAGVEALVDAGHQLMVEKGAGIPSGFTDDFYSLAGAEMVDGPEDVWARADMIMKVKEPIEPEWPRMRAEQVIFTYFHFAASEPLTRAVMKSGAVAIAYETVELRNGELPLLTPMSEVAGRMAVQEGARFLEKHSGGSGVLLSGVPGVLPGKVLILGGGVVGTNAAKIAAGMGANVTIFDINLDRLRYLDDVMPRNVDTVVSTPFAVREALVAADLVIGAVLVEGAKAPNLVTRDMLKDMQEAAVIVDVAVDQGGCVETTRPTTHHDPVYEVDGILHYAVANMPGAVPRTSTYGLTNATLPYAVRLADRGLEALKADEALLHGLNIHKGGVTHQGVADAFGLVYTDPRQALA